MNRFYIAALFSLLFYSTPFTLASAMTRPLAKGLSKSEAERRSAAIKDVHYDLSFVLSDKEREKSFSGSATIRFEALDSTVPLTIDFAGGKARDVFINGVRQKHVQANAYFLTLPLLKAGKNEVRVDFSHPYSTNGSGLYRFKDPEDGKHYIYSDFEPFEANQLFPAFDQPDLKATYTVAVDAPKDWVVVTSVREASPPVIKAGRASWTFPESAKFSTYLFSLIAGPYRVWESDADGIPLRLLARPTLEKYVPVEEWFKITKQGLAFYGKLFDYNYPFKKYDQAIVPDFNAGAMENVANVTFSEREVPRGAVTASEREGRANVILHEMAHMWFGDLVTMKWWNDLWLNESFASYMEVLATVEATEFKRSWQSFYTDTKQWAYWEDQLVTTHPIEGDVPDTEQAFASFDGITYGKGAASLKALSYYVGADKFRDGVRLYFKDHQYGNAELKDFMGSIAKASGQDLTSWTNEWLRTAGLNTVEAQYKCKDGKIATFALKQTAAAENPTIRSHRTKIGLFEKSATGPLESQKVVEVSYQGALTSVPSLVGEACPYLVYPNIEDYDYVKVRLDPASLEAVKKDLSLVTDSLLRSMLWTSLWDSVRDGEWPVTAYADTVFSQLPAETDDKIIEKVTQTLQGRRRTSVSLLLYMPEEGGKKAAFAAQAEAFAWTQFEKSAPGSDAQKLWFDSLVRLTRSEPGLTKLEALLDGNIPLKGLEIDQDRRWGIVLQLAEGGAKDAEARRKSELKRDGSNHGKLAAITGEVLVPSAAVKAHWYKKIIDPNSKMSLAELKSAMAGMFPTSQIDFRKGFEASYFHDLPILAKTKENEFIGRFASNLSPTYCTQRSLQAVQEFISKHQDLQPVALKEIRVEAQEDGRCIKIRQVAGELKPTN